MTTPARTLFDLAALLRLHQLERAVNEGEVRMLTSPTSLDALVARHPGRRGATALRKILEGGAIGSAMTRSELEARFLALLDAHGLPRAATNRSIAGFEVDGVWPHHRLVVELDGYETHGTRQAFEDDRSRDRALAAAGYRVVRITDRQVTSEATAIAAELSTLLRDTVPGP